jgi:hypothetical protein
MRHILLLVLVALLPPGLASAQISHGGTPPSLDRDLGPLLSADVPTALMPAVDVDALVHEDLTRDLDKSLPWRFGEALAVDLGFDQGGLWETLSDGSRVWRMTIRSPGAVSLDLAFEVFVMPPGAEFFVRSADGADVLGAFTEANNKVDGRFATDWIFGDEIVLEYYEPGSAPFPGELSLVRVTHGYRTPKAGQDAALNNSGSCQNNVNCPPLTTGWGSQSRSVALISMGGGLCTGALINNTSNDGTPYFLTADHCYSNPSWWVFHFNYEADGCGNPSGDPASDTVSSASLVANNSNSDFVLLELSSTPPTSYGVYYAGWSRTSSAPDSAACIHHPAGDIKKFSYEGSQVSPSGNFWDVGPWDDGTTEGGSSGSPLFDQNHRIVGQLYGGSSACWGSGENNGSDIYGRLDVSWSGFSSGSRLSDWLDPSGSGPMSIDGFDPATPVSPIDASVSFVSPSAGSLHCTTTVTVQVQLTNSGSESLTAVDLDYLTDGGSWSSQAWSGVLSPGSSTTVTLPTITLTAGGHDLEVSVDASGDGNPGNDSASVDFSVQGSAGVHGVDQPFDGGAFPPSEWSLLNPDGAEAWTRTTTGGSGAAHFNNFDDDYRGEVDSLYTPFLDLTGTASPALVFDLAYARYDGEYTDGLNVRVSDDCGAGWDTVYSKSGTTLATAPDHDEAFAPTSGEWRTETVSLASYASESNLLIAFDNVTGYGNNLFIDNVLVGTPQAGDDDGPPGDDDNNGGPGDDDNNGGPGDDDDDSDQDDEDAGGDGTNEGSGGVSDGVSDGVGEVGSGDMYVVEPYCACDAGWSVSGGAGWSWLVGVVALAGLRRRH